MTGPSVAQGSAIASRWMFGVLSLVVALDQFTKWRWRSESVINTGISGSLGQGMSHWVILILVMVVLLGTAWWSQRWWQRYPVVLGLLLGGGISNWWDRVWFGGVRDWLSIPVLGWKNNLADCAIALAVVGLGWQMLLWRHHES